MLLSNGNELIRILQTQDNRSLVIDCIKRTMPKWFPSTDFVTWAKCTEDELYVRTGMILDRELTQEEQRIAQEHFTMIAGVLPFIGNEPKRNQMIDLLSEHQSKQTIRKYLCLYLVYIRYNDAIYNRKGKPFMRYCPLCAAADRQRYGETYWHRKAQLAGINICLKHRCRLVDSTVGLAVEGLRFKLIHAEFVIPQDTVADFNVSDLEYQSAEYALQVFDSPMEYENDVLIGKFLKSRLEGTKYTSLRGEQVFARILHDDLRAYYQDLLPPTLSEWYHIQKIFCSQTFHTYDICLLAMFLGISVEDLLNPTLPEFTLQQRFDAQLRLLRSQGMTQREAAAELGLTLETVKSLEQKRLKKKVD